MAANARKPAGWRKPEACPICQHPSDDYVSDHCHATGMGRAWICRACNTGLGMFKDNPEALERAAAYLREHQAKIAEGGAVEWMKGQYRMAHPRA